jgi:hypothetical protein
MQQLAGNETQAKYQEIIINKSNKYAKLYYTPGSLMIIRSQRKKNALVTALADEEMLKIMNSVMHRSKSFNEIAAENGDIPRTSAFRKIKWLLNEDILIVDKIVITPAGKKFSLFQCTLRAINVKYEDNDVIVEAEQNIDIPKKWAMKFFSLD